MGYTGSQGMPGGCGSPGSPGNDGTSVTIIGTVPTAGGSGSPQSNLDVIGTAYPVATYGNGVIAEDTGHLWVYSYGNGSDVWVDVGQIKGDMGYTGSAGATGGCGSPGGIGYTGSQGTVYISNMQPGSANAGDLWYDDFGGRMYIYYTDVDSSQWVDTNPSVQGYTGSAGGGGNGDQLVSSNMNYQLTLDNTGDLAFSSNSSPWNMRIKFPGRRNYQGTTPYTDCPTGTNTVIWTSSDAFATSARLTIHAEVWTGSGNYYSDFDTQTTELLLAVKIVNNVPTVAKVSVYGSVYTSDTILATYDAQINTSTNRVEIICIPDASVTNKLIVKTNYFESGSSGQEEYC
jgi:hypothetical protein